MADPITWPVAVSIIGGITVTVVVFAGYVVQSFKRETPWKDDLDKLDDLVVKLETKNTSLTHKVDDLQNTVTEHEKRNSRDFDRIYERLEKVTDLMIDMLREEAPSHLDKPEK